MKKPKKKGLSAAQFLASVQLFYQSSPPVRVPFKLLSIFSQSNYFYLSCYFFRT
jgi:hypothetical protein